MNDGPLEIYQPRSISDRGICAFDTVQFKVYDLLANGKTVDAALVATAKRFVKDEVLDRVVTLGASNRLGFIIIHPGDLGVSISAHWWAQGSVLCQHIYRKHYDEREPLDTVTRPVVACVWELALINAEREAWQQYMMNANPDPSAYLAARPSS